MGSFITDLKNSFNKGNIYIQFIYINVGVFAINVFTSFKISFSLRIYTKGL